MSKQYKAITNSVNNKPFLEMLGTASDREVAATFGYAPADVRRIRMHYGIPVFRSAATKLSRNKMLVATLGTADDSLVAKRFSCSTEAVSALRRQLKIPAFAEKPEPQLPAVIQNDMDKLFRYIDYKGRLNKSQPTQLTLF